VTPRPGRLPFFCASVLALCTVVLAAVALFVWPKLFAATPDGVPQHEVLLASDLMRYWAPIPDPARFASGHPR
jgi:hypothetical protein